MILNPGIYFVYQLLGNVTPDELPLEVALPIFRSQVEKYAQWYELSVQNYFTTAKTMAVPANEFLLGIPNLKEVIQVQTLHGLDWRPIQIVSLEALDYEQRQGRLSCAIFGMGADTRIRLSTDFEPFIPGIIRIWYEPAIEPEELLEQVPQHFINLVAYETALKCIPFLIPKKTQEEAQALQVMAANYTKEVEDLKRIFDVSVNWTGEHRPHRPRPFRRRNFFRV
jgi:hypothetical protein